MRYQSDYIMRVIEQMGQLLRVAFERFREGEDEQPYAMSAEAIGMALDIDPELVGRLSPASLASLLDLQSPDDRVVELVARALDLETAVRERQGMLIEAAVHRSQAAAVRALIDGQRAN